MTRTPTGWLALLALGLGCAACTSRTLPLPPPNVDRVAPSVQGLVLVRGTAQEGASVGIVNDATMTGVIVTSPETDCSSACPYEAQIEAQPGDTLRVWQFYETTGGLEVQVPE